MSGNKNKTTKRQRTPRVVPPSEYKRVNRGGSGKPQPRQITAAGRVNGIRTMLKQYAMSYLTQAGETVDDYRENYLNSLIGLPIVGIDEADWAVFVANLSEDDQPVRLTEAAFVFAYRLVPDARYIDAPGSGFEFFSPAMAKKDREEIEAAQQRREHNRNRRNGGRAHVAQRVAEASGLSA